MSEITKHGLEDLDLEQQLLEEQTANERRAKLADLALRNLIADFRHTGIVELGRVPENTPIRVELFEDSRFTDSPSPEEFAFQRSARKYNPDATIDFKRRPLEQPSLRFVGESIRDDGPKLNLGFKGHRAYSLKTNNADEPGQIVALSPLQAWEFNHPGNVTDLELHEGKQGRFRKKKVTPLRVGGIIIGGIQVFNSPDASAIEPLAVQ